MNAVGRLLDQRRVVTAGLVLGTLLLAYQAGQANPLPVMGLAVAVAAILFMLKRPSAGLWLVPVAALCVPFQIGTGSQTAVHAVLLLIPVLLGIWILEMMGRHSVRLVPSIVNAPALALAVSATLSFAGGQLAWNYLAELANTKAQAGGWAVFVLSVGALLLAGNRIKHISQLKALTYAFLGIGAVIVCGDLWPGLQAILKHVVVEGGKGGLFWVWLVALSSGQALFNRSTGTRARLVLLGVAFGSLAVRWWIGRDWLSGWLPGLAALGVLLWLRSWRWGMIVTIAALCLFLLQPRLSLDVAVADQYSAITRQAAWDIVINKVVPNNPILGLGPANYYHYTPLYPIMGYAVKFNSHNQYVDLLAQLGIVGMAVFLWLMAAIAGVGWRLRQRVGDGFARGYVYACLAGLVGTLVAGMLGDWFLPFVYNIGLAGFRASILGWLFLGGLIALESMPLSQLQGE